MNRSQLLSKSIDNLRQEVRRLQMEEIEQSGFVQRLLDASGAFPESRFPASLVGQRAQALLNAFDSSADDAPAAPSQPEVKLWVDEFAPRHYTGMTDEEKLGTTTLIDRISPQRSHQ